MKKISTVEIERIGIFKPNQLTTGLDLGDRTSYYCILDEAGEVIFEHELLTTPKGIEEVYVRIPRSRIALETGTHSPWVSRQVKVGARSDRSACAQGATDQREQPKR